jgi:hypothetical protein
MYVAVHRQPMRSARGMSTRTASLFVVAVLALAGGLAAFQSHSDRPSVATPSPAEPTAIAMSMEPSPALPPDHPAIGSINPHASTIGVTPTEEEHAAIAWKAPPSWRVVPNPSSMRIATYRIPGTKGDDEEGELSVTRAGGTAQANADRWIGQFDGAADASRETRTIQGFRVTIVSVSGTFRGGGMMGAPSPPRPSWALLGAIVETPDSPYFFKLVGPLSTVKSSRPSFDAMIAGLTRL